MKYTPLNDKKIILTGGGTAGHVTPNMALIPKLQELGCEIHYIGRKSGIEKNLITQTGIPYHGINAGKLRRYFDMKNISDIFRIIQGTISSLLLIKKLRPQLVFSKGGFVSCPVVWAAWLNRIPIIIHESDMTPGLANRLSMPFSDKICVSFPETQEKLPRGKAIYTGIPVRETLLSGNSEEGKTICGFTDSKPIILIIGGSLGSETINQAIRTELDNLLEMFNICHICGRGKVETNFEAHHGYRQFEYVSKELSHFLAMADLVISRAGATTLFELLELKKANLLIPLSLKASRGDQILNAKSFTKRGFSHMLLEEDLSPARLIEGIRQAYLQRDTMLETMNSSGTMNGLKKVLDVIQSTVYTKHYRK